LYSLKFFLKLHNMGYVFDFHDAKAYEQWYKNQRNRFEVDLENQLLLDMLNPSRGDSVLDIGCGYGYFVRQALAAGFDAYGVDLSTDGIREAEKHAPGRCFRGTLDDVEELAGRRFDVIFASHLIEHILKPQDFIETLIPHLNEGGIVMFVTPNISSWLARVSGRRWVSFKIPEHVAYYTPATISHLLESAGLEVVAIDPAYQYYRLPFLMSKIREMVDPIGRLVPGFEHWGSMRDRILRVTSGSLRVVARTAERSQEAVI